SVNVTNSMFISNREVAIHAISSGSAIKGNYIERGDQGISPIGIISAGSTLTIENNDIHSMSTGIYLLNTNDLTVDNLVMDSETLGLFVVNSILNSTGDSLLDNRNGVELDDHSDAVFENLTVSGYKEGFAAFDHSKAVLFNSSVQEVEVLTFELAQSSSVILVNTEFETLSGNPGVTIGISDDSTLTIQNFLTVEVVSYDSGAHLADATVGISDALGPISLTTGPDGFTPTVASTDRIYEPTLVDYPTLIEVTYPDTYFEDNNRFVDMDSSRIEVFNGSVYDMDEDGEPDFSDDDIDGDDLENDQESSLGTDPMDPDTDDDGLPDGYEHEYSEILDPLVGTDAMLDPDEDGLDNLGEFLNGTDPGSADSDTDNVGDLVELECGLDPLNHTDSAPDWDDDGYSNGKECKAGTDLLDPDDHPIEGEFDYLFPIIAIVLVVVVILAFVLFGRRRKVAEEAPPAEEEPEEAE
ncbi:MAG: right-handed parallel beta-helix repeat-containing protein, partial [Thermoplasmata archaeon]|nr:right-handed parallel beta-helix repeat-containing protein [Thermoplasmata archaeon]